MRCLQIASPGMPDQLARPLTLITLVPFLVQVPLDRYHGHCRRVLHVLHRQEPHHQPGRAVSASCSSRCRSIALPLVCHDQSATVLCSLYPASCRCAAWPSHPGWRASMRRSALLTRPRPTQTTCTEAWPAPCPGSSVEGPAPDTGHSMMMLPSTSRVAGLAVGPIPPALPAHPFPFAAPRPPL